MDWINADKNTPNAYKTGNWDGRNSDEVIAEDKAGKRYIAHFCKGTIDGSTFEDWYDNNDFLIFTKIVRWVDLPE